MGEQQRRRRREVLARGFSHAHTMAMVDHLPFTPTGRRRRGNPFDPTEGAYAEARDVLLADYAEHGTRVLFTGLGGDEAMKLRVLDGGALLVEDGYLDEAELRSSAQEFMATGERTFDVYRPLILETGLASLQAR